MITITDIVGESINLRNGQETPRGLMISNGLSSALIHVSDDDLEKVVQMWAETQQAVGEVQPQPIQRAPLAPEEPRSADAPSLFSPERDVEDEDDFDQGETYGGVQSI